MSSLDSPLSPWWHTAALLRGSCFGILPTLRGLARDPGIIPTARGSQALTANPEAQLYVWPACMLQLCSIRRHAGVVPSGRHGQAADVLRRTGCPTQFLGECWHGMWPLISVADAVTIRRAASQAAPDAVCPTGKAEVV